MKKIKNVIIFSNNHDWHSKQLKKELQKLSCKVFYRSLEDCYINTSLKKKIYIPGFEQTLPDGCFVRIIGKGSFEQITRRLTILHVLKALKIPLFNDIDCIEKTTDKSMTTFLLSYFGLKTPLTWVPEKKRIAKEILQKQSKKKLISILKPLFGSQGKRIKILKNNKLNESLDNVYYLQNFENNKSRTSEKNWEDYRILVCHQKVIASIKRTNKKELTNISQGARPIKINPNKEMVKIAIKASTLVKADYAGVDIIKDKNEKLKILEINSIPAWKGLQKTTKKNIAAILAKAFLKKINKKKS